MLSAHAHLYPGEHRYCEHHENGSKSKWLH
jgi:hypothetical protein